MPCVWSALLVGPGGEARALTADSVTSLRASSWLTATENQEEGLCSRGGFDFWQWVDERGRWGVSFGQGRWAAFHVHPSTS